MAGRGIGQALRDVGNKLGPGEIQRIADNLGVSTADVYAKAADKGIKLSSATQSAAATGAYQPKLVEPISTGSTTSGGGGSSFGGYQKEGIDATLAELNSATTGYEWDTRKAIAQLQEAGATERLKYEVDNRIPLTEAEYKGKIDLQKIVNAGNRRVANIQRGSQMFASMMGAFNF